MLLTIDFPGIERLCLSPQATRLALANSGAPGEVLVVAASSGQPVHRYSGLGERPRPVFRSESKLLILHAKQCSLCDCTTGSRQDLPLKTGGGSGSLYCCGFSPDGRTVALGGAIGGLLLLDLGGRRKPRLIDLPEQAELVEGIDYSPDGQFVSIDLVPLGEDRAMRLVVVLDVRSGKEVRRLKLPWAQFHVYPTAFRPDNQALAVGWKSNVLLFGMYPPKSPLDPEVLFGAQWLHAIGWARPMACHPVGDNEEVSGVWFTGDGTVLKALCNSGKAVLLSADDGRVLQATPAPDEDQAKLWGANISMNGRAAATAHGKVLIWDVPGWDAAGESRTTRRS
jgi:WD40 repeat protein